MESPENEITAEVNEPFRFMGTSKGAKLSSRIISRFADGPHNDVDYVLYLLAHPDEFGYATSVALQIWHSVYETFTVYFDPVIACAKDCEGDIFWDTLMKIWAMEWIDDVGM